MRWLVALDELEAEGLIDAAQAAEMKRRAREDAATVGINTVYVAGILGVTLGAVLWSSGPLDLARAGLLLLVAGAAAVLRFGERLRIPAHAAATIGLALLLGGLGWRIEQSAAPGAWQMALGAAAALAGVAARTRLPPRFAFVAGMTAVAGLALHLWGLLAHRGDPALAWLAVSYAGAAVLALGLRLDVRALSGLSIAFFAASLSAARYAHASYGVAIYESALTIVQFALIATLCLIVTRFGIERWSRHARVVGLLAFVWINMAFWIGSLWGDVVGAHLWGPQRADFFAHLEGRPYDARAWAEAQDAAQAAAEAFEARALVIAPAAFSIVWAALLLVVGLWAALSDRRSILNAAMAFGAIHFYTQWFETFAYDPAALVAAGGIAIFLAWGARAANLMLARRGPGG